MISLRHKHHPTLPTFIIQHAMPTSRPLQRLQPLRLLRPLLHRAYHSPTAPPPPLPFSPLQTTILSSALTHQVPTHGFTPQSLSLAAQACGYLPATAPSLFPNGAFDLVHYHLLASRHALSEAPPPTAPDAETESPSATHAAPTPTLQSLIMRRLRLNTPILPHLPTALTLLQRPSNLRTSASELFSLASTLLYLSHPAPAIQPAEPEIVTGRWYTDRAGVAALYAAAERRLAEGRKREGVWGEVEGLVGRGLNGGVRFGGMLGNVAEWVAGTGRGVVNVARSKGVRI